MQTKKELSQHLKDNVVIMRTTGCWYWKGQKSHAGTPILYWQRRTQTVLRVLYWIKYGEHPPKRSRIKRLHTCDDQQACVNPDHVTFIHGKYEALENKLQKKCLRPGPASKDYYKKCWIWADSHGAAIQWPTFTFEGAKYKVRDLLFERYQGVPVPEHKRITVQCGQWGCVNPEHLYLGGYNVPITHKYQDLKSKKVKETRNERHDQQ